ncbi:TPA: hypothetical protein QDZ42_001913 [Stenotrophomonas maltophilia]|nr:hypothetical protein [Stenotrophomonas maltophilia]HDS1043260.1 hypothetical protein [Stenotrophomonas maltophilia]
MSPLPVAGNEAGVQYFDIPSQPLAQALQQFGEHTGLAVLVDTRLLQDRRSAPVTGELLQGEALRQMVAGTGLVPRRVEQGAFTLVADGERKETTQVAQEPAATALPRALAIAPRAAGAIQRGLEQALCASVATRPGSYEATVRFQLDRSQRLQQVELLQGTGDGPRDAALVRQLQGVRLPGMPHDLPQPVTVRLLPASAQRSVPCQDLP